MTYLWFYPREPGEHLITCAEYCGMMHSKMIGKVIVVKPEEFAAWYEESRRVADANAAKSGG